MGRRDGGELEFQRAYHFAEDSGGAGVERKSGKDAWNLNLICTLYCSSRQNYYLSAYAVRHTDPTTSLQ